MTSKIKTKSLLNDHLTANFHFLKSKYKSIGFCFSGDFNDFKPDVLLSQSPQLRQLIYYNTCGGSSLEKIITDMHASYQPPLPIESVNPNNPEMGEPSEHCANKIFPKADSSTNSKRTFKTIKIRPISNPQMDAMGQVLIKESWKNVLEIPSPEDKITNFY